MTLNWRLTANVPDVLRSTLTGCNRRNAKETHVDEFELEFHKIGGSVAFANDSPLKNVGRRWIMERKCCFAQTNVDYWIASFKLEEKRS
jgi:hypothetical protein